MKRNLIDKKIEEKFAELLDKLESLMIRVKRLEEEVVSRMVAQHRGLDSSAQGALGRAREGIANALTNSSRKILSPEVSAGPPKGFASAPYLG